MAGPAAPEPSRRGAAALVVQAHLRAHRDAVVGHDPGARVGGAEDVHKMRVATRRLRSALRTFRPLLDRGVSEPLRAELTWLAGVLGQARDTQVMWDRLDSMVEEEPSDVATTDVRGAMDSELREAHDAAVAAAAAALGSVRYFRLLDALDELVRRPPWTPLALGSADDVLRPCVRAEWKRLRRRVRAAQAAEPGHDRDEHLHEVRKAAKRLRYAAEAVRAGVRGARPPASPRRPSRSRRCSATSTTAWSPAPCCASSRPRAPAGPATHCSMAGCMPPRSGTQPGPRPSSTPPGTTCSRRRLRRWLRP